MAVTYKTQNDLGGLITEFPEDKIPNRNASDIESIDMSLSGMIQTSGGFENYANQISPGATAGSIVSMFLFKKNFGTFKKIKLRTRDNGTNTILEWLNPDNPNTSDGKWEPLHSTFTTGTIMGYAPFNDSTANQIVLGNGTDNMSTWNGATATVASVTANTIVCNETLATEDFDSTGDVEVDGTQYAYTGITAKTLTGVTPAPTTQAPVAGSGVAQSPDVTTHSADPKGNVMTVAGARLWIATINTSVLNYSVVANATDFTVATTPDAAGIEDFPDGGGPITLLDARENRRIIIHKEDGLLVFQLNYTAAAKIPQLDVVTLAQDSGATNLKAGAGENNVSYYTSGQEGIKSLRRALESDDALNIDSITDVIMPTIDAFDFSTAASVYYPSKRAIFVACKKSSSSSNNDTVIAYYIRRGVDGKKQGDLSIYSNIYVNDWLVDGENLYAGSSVSQNVYKMFARNSANGVGIKHKWVSKGFEKSKPEEGKEFNIVYLNGLIKADTKIKVTILYGPFGVEGSSKSATIKWNDNTYVFDTKVSAIGVNIIGTMSLGARSPDILDSYPFSVPIQFSPQKSIRYKVLIETLYDEETIAESYWAITSLSINPILKGIDERRKLNSNT